MTRLIMNRLMIFGLALLLAACGRDSDTPEAAAADAPRASASAAADSALAADLLARIDADSALVWLTLEPMPEALMNRIWSSLAAMEDWADDEQLELAGEAGSSLVAALVRESQQLTSMQAYMERGLDPNGLAALHLVGSYPFMHWQLSDAEAFEATLARIESESDGGFPRREVGDQEIIWINVNEFGLAVHHDGNFLSMALVSDREDLLERVTNRRQSPQPIRQADLNAFMRQRELLANNFGYVDHGRLMSVLLDGEDALSVRLRSDSPLGRVAEDSACRRELNQLSALFPRHSFGAIGLSESSMSGKMTLESDAEFGARLAAIANSPVSLELPGDSMTSIGVGLNLVAARDFGRQIVGGWVQSPPQCFLFSNVAENAAAWQLTLNRPIPPLVTNIHGARMNLSGISISAEGAPDIAGTLAVFMRNPQMLVGMGQMFSPELAALDLRPGAPPQRLPAEMTAEFGGIPAWAGLSQTGLGIAFGEGQDAALPGALSAGSADSAVMSFAMDFSAVAELLQSDFADLQLPADSDLDRDEMAEAIQVFASLYRYLAGSLHLSETGIEFRMTVELP